MKHVPRDKRMVGYDLEAYLQRNALDGLRTGSGCID